MSSSLAAHLFLLLDAGVTTSINLNTLSFEDVNHYIQEITTCETISLNVVGHIYQISKGNAFWVFLLIRFVRDCGVTEFEKLLELHMADNVLASCLLSNYTMLQVNIIKAASVCGEEFDTDVLMKLVPHVKRAEMMRALIVFVNGGLLYRLEDNRLRFHNELIKKAIYDMIPKRFTGYK